MKFHHIYVGFMFLMVMISSPLEAQRGAMTTPRNIDELTQNAETIVQCNIISAIVEPHPQFKNLNTILVMVRVTQSLKGNNKNGDTFQFRQFIWDIRDRRDAAGYMQMGELILFLNKNNQFGLTSPVGMGQGRFHISRDRSGSLVATNESNNLALFQNTRSTFQRKSVRVPEKLLVRIDHANGGPVALDDLKKLVRSLVGEQNQ